MHLDGKPKRDRQHHSLSKNASRRGALNGPPRPATASPNVPPLNRRQATRHHCASVRMSWSSGAAGALTEASSNCGHQIPRVGRISLPGSTLERVRRPIARSIPRTGPGRSSTLERQRHRRCAVLRPAPDPRETTRYRGYPTQKILRLVPGVPNLGCPHSREPGVRNRHRCDCARPRLTTTAFGSLTAGRGHTSPDRPLASARVPVRP